MYTCTWGNRIEHRIKRSQVIITYIMCYNIMLFNDKTQHYSPYSNATLQPHSSSRHTLFSYDNIDYSKQHCNRVSTLIHSCHSSHPSLFLPTCQTLPSTHSLLVPRSHTLLPQYHTHIHYSELSHGKNNSQKMVSAIPSHDCRNDAQCPHSRSSCSSRCLIYHPQQTYQSCS